MDLIYGTTNQNKLKEMRKYLKEFNILSLEEIGFNKEIIEDGNSFKENSLIKAKEIKKYCKENNIKGFILTDDAGLCCDGLNGAPGIYSARYGGDHPKQEIALNKLMDDLKGKNRLCSFHCALTFVTENDYIQVEGILEGKISEKIGKLGGFTFGPVFVPKGYDKPYNEIENLLTHRHIALNLLLDKLKELNII